MTIRRREAKSGTRRDVEWLLPDGTKRSKTFKTLRAAKLFDGEVRSASKFHGGRGGPVMCGEGVVSWWEGRGRRRVSCGVAGFLGPVWVQLLPGLVGMGPAGQGMASTRLNAVAKSFAQGQVSGTRRVLRRAWSMMRVAVCNSR